MPKPKNYARIAITLPERDLAAADRLARTQDRSRSWIIAEAVRRYATASDAAPDEGGHSAGAVSAEAGDARRAVGRPASVTVVREGLGPLRLAQLMSDMELTPEARMLAAEETLRQTGTPRPRRHHVLAFDRYEDFLDWKKVRAAGG